MPSTNVGNVDDIANAYKKTTDTKSKSEKASAALAQNFDDFLKLLTTQLQNQDPTNPMDTNNFTQQIASLSTVEQQIQTNKNLENMISLYNSSQVSSVVGYIGKRIEADGNKSVLEGGIAIFNYDLPEAADKVKISISNAAGGVVYTGDADKKAGRNEVYWDGTNSFTGAQLQDGTYTFTIEALNASGEALEAVTYTTGRVTAVDFKDGKSTVVMGTLEMPMDEILTIREDPLTTGLIGGVVPPPAGGDDETDEQAAA